MKFNNLFSLPFTCYRTLAPRHVPLKSTVTALEIASPRGGNEAAQPRIRKNSQLSIFGRVARTGCMAARRHSHCLDHGPLCVTRLSATLRSSHLSGSRYPSRQIASGHRSATSGETRNLVRKLQFESSPEETLGQSSSPIRAAEGTERQLVRLSAAASRFPSRNKSTMEENL